MESQNPETSRAAKWVGNIGLLFYTGPLFGFVGTVIGMIRAFKTLANAGEPSPSQLAGDISITFMSTLIGMAAGLVGLILIMVAQHALKHREPAFYRNAMVMSAFWCLMLFPYGAIIGVPMMIGMYCKRNACLSEEERKRLLKPWVVVATFAFIALLIFLRFSCASRFEDPPPNEVEVEAEMERIFGVGVPEEARLVEVQIATLMTHVVDFKFSCPEPVFEEFWNSVPRLADEVPAHQVNLDPQSAEADFEGSWKANRGRQYVTIYAHRLESGEVLVDIQTTHEMN